jgi:F-type H+-transporting ATPase subunit delta
LKPIKQAQRYAKALIRNVGVENAPKALAELSLINDLMVKNKEFKNFLVNPRFTPEEREAVIKQLADKLKLSEGIAKFILLLAEQRVIVALSELIRYATNLYYEKKKKAKATVISPIEITKDKEEKIKASLKKITDKELDIEYVVDPSLLGGILIKIGSTMYDTSIKGQLRLLKDELIKG